MTKIKHDAMVGMDTDMCNIPENDSYNYHIMAYHKDVTGEILNTVPTQPNLLITHKNSMYMSGYWGSSSSVLSWRLLNLGDGTDILTTTTTTTTPKPTQYIINGSFAVPLYGPEMTLVNPRTGSTIPINVEFEGEDYDDLGVPSYSNYIVTTTVNPAVYELRVSGRDSLWIANSNYWSGTILLPRDSYWVYNPNTGDYVVTRDFTSSILTTTTTTTTSTSTTTTTTTSPASYSYTLSVSFINSLSNTNVTVTNPRIAASRYVAGVKNGSRWTFNFTMPVNVATGWTFQFTSFNQLETRTAILANRSFTNRVCIIDDVSLMQSGVVTNFPGIGEITIAPFSLDDPEDTNSLDDAINDYLNE